MNKTIYLIVGVFFAMLFLALALRTVWTSFQDTTEVVMSDIQLVEGADTLTITWRTDVDTVGRLYYTVAGVRASEPDNRFSRVHSVTVESLNGSVEYYIESCNTLGTCVSSQPYRAVFTLNLCPDSTPYGRCSKSRPYFCDAGSLLQDCRRCDCPLGSACAEDGSCEIV